MDSFADSIVFTGSRVKVDLKLRSDLLQPSWTLADALLSDKETAIFGKVKEHTFETRKLERVTANITPPDHINLISMQQPRDCKLEINNNNTLYKPLKNNHKIANWHQEDVNLDSELQNYYWNNSAGLSESLPKIAPHTSPRTEDEIVKLEHNLQGFSFERENIPRLKHSQEITKLILSDHLERIPHDNPQEKFLNQECQNNYFNNNTTTHYSIVNRPQFTNRYQPHPEEYLDEYEHNETRQQPFYQQQKHVDRTIQTRLPGAQESRVCSHGSHLSHSNAYNNEGNLYHFQDYNNRNSPSSYFMQHSQADKNLWCDEPMNIEEIMQSISESDAKDSNSPNQELLKQSSFNDAKISEQENLKKIGTNRTANEDHTCSFQTISAFPQPSSVHDAKNSIRTKADDAENQMGMQTIPKGSCGACGKMIAGQVLMALGKIWHLDHFRCGHCGIKLGTNIFYEKDGLAYCEHDYITIFSPRCEACDGPVLEKCITALNKSWHPHHFVCSRCKSEFGEEGYHEMNGQPYCSRDFYNLFAPKCFGCGEAITSNYITALHHQWHPNCFVCFECEAPFTSGSFYDHEGRPLCEEHFNVLIRGSCASCQQTIVGPSVTAIGKKYHPGHLVCTFCLQVLNRGTFKEHNYKPYCHQCSEKLFG